MYYNYNTISFMKNVGFLIKLFNVNDTSNDKTSSGITWVEAYERISGNKINDLNLVGAHMSTTSGLSGAINTEYIAIITKEQNSFSNFKEILVDQKVVERFSLIKKRDKNNVILTLKNIRKTVGPYEKIIFEDKILYRS